MENEKREATAENGRIVLRLNSYMKPGPCALCGAECRPDGFDFFIEGTKDFVCAACVKEKAPDLYLIHDGAHEWREKDLRRSFEEGVISGKKTAGQMILDALDEPEIERVKRVCRVDLGVKACWDDDLPF